MTVKIKKVNKFSIGISQNFEFFKSCQTIFIEKVDEKDLDDSFHKSIKPIACFVQFMFLMPVCGIKSDNPKNLKFKWCSLRVLITLAYIFYGIIIACLYFDSIRKNIDAMNAVGLIFFTYTTICTIIFLTIAIKWPRMMKQWSNVEEKFLHSPYRKTDWKLSKKIKIVAVTVIILAFFEHLLYLANSAFNIYQDVVKNNLTVDEPLNHFLKSQFGYIYLDVPFSVPLGVFNEIMNMSFTFGWNYMELFVMMISLGLSTRFKQINERLKNFKEKILSEQQWSKIREDYSSLCNLVAIIDFDLRYLILLSNLNNVYFICFQLLNIFEKLPYVINTIYFWFSLIYLASRTFVAQFLAASIHESAKFPIQIISSIPHEGWCNEMQRFADQARAQDVALSGMKFFNLTRKSILSLCSMIVTYELVLMQIRNFN